MSKLGGEYDVRYLKACRFVKFVSSLHEGSHSLNRAEVNHAPGSYVYTMGILYRQIPRWLTVQLVNSGWCYVSTRPVRRLLNQELLEFIVFWLKYNSLS